MKKAIIHFCLFALFAILVITIPTKIVEAKKAPIYGGYSCLGDGCARDSQGNTIGTDKADDGWTCCGKKTVAGAKP